MRLRVRSDIGIAGRYWWFDLLNTQYPEGHQIAYTGVRSSWREALTDGLRVLRNRQDATPDGAQ